MIFLKKFKHTNISIVLTCDLSDHQLATDKIVVLST